MKEILKNNKKKIIIALITIGALFFPPVANLLPVVEVTFPQDAVSAQK